MSETIDLNAVVEHYRQSIAEPQMPGQAPFNQLLQTLVKERTEKIIDALVVSHRNKDITPQEALSAVASIFALRCLVSDLHTRTQRS